MPKLNIIDFTQPRPQRPLVERLHEELNYYRRQLKSPDYEPALVWADIRRVEAKLAALDQEDTIVSTLPAPAEPRVVLESRGRTPLPMWEQPPSTHLSSLKLEDAYLLSCPIGPVASPLLVDGPFSLPFGEVASLVGDGGMGKSWVALDLAVSVALGLPFLGGTVRQGNVVYLDFEQNKEKAHTRIRRLASGYGADTIRLLGRLTYRNYTDRGVYLPALLEEIELLLSTAKPTLIVVDGRQAAFGGNAVDMDVVTDANRVLRSLTRGGSTTVLELDHPSSGSASKQEPSGNRFKRQFSRAQWWLEASNKDDKDALTLKLQKDNDGLPRTQVSFRRVDTPEGGVRHEQVQPTLKVDTSKVKELDNLPENSEERYWQHARRALEGTELTQRDFIAALAQATGESQSTIKRKVTGPGGYLASWVAQGRIVTRAGQRNATFHALAE